MLHCTNWAAWPMMPGRSDIPSLPRRGTSHRGARQTRFKFNMVAIVCQRATSVCSFFQEAMVEASGAVICLNSFPPRAWPHATLESARCAAWRVKVGGGSSSPSPFREHC